MWHETASQLTQDGRSFRIEPTERWVRGQVGESLVVDSRRALLLLSSQRPPVYYFPRDDIDERVLEVSQRTTIFPVLGRTLYWDVVNDGRRRDDAAFEHVSPPAPLEGLKEHLAFKWSALDHWFEEDEEIFVHPRDPFTRVDSIASSRRVRIELEGQTLAESSQPVLLFETGLPTRYYLPAEDVRLENLNPSETHTHCPYKGVASYWSVEIGGRIFPDLVWSYLEPLPESAKIAGRMCFFNERVDTFVDGVLQARPHTAWS